MNNACPSFFRFLWAALTEVPGWPDAPYLLRLRHALPVLLPVALICGGLAFHFGSLQPHSKAVRRDLAPARALETEIEALNQSGSATQQEELKRLHASRLAATLTTDTERSELAQEIRSLALRQGWAAKPSWLANDTAAPLSPLSEQTLRLRFELPVANTSPFPSFLSLLATLAEQPKALQHRSLRIRADDTGWNQVEAHYTALFRSPHEQATP